MSVLWPMLERFFSRSFSLSTEIVVISLRRGEVESTGEIWDAHRTAQPLANSVIAKSFSFGQESAVAVFSGLCYIISESKILGLADMVFWLLDEGYGAVVSSRVLND